MANDLGHQQTGSQVYVYRSINVGIYDGSLCDMNDEVVKLIRQVAFSSVSIAICMYIIMLISCVRMGMGK